MIENEKEELERQRLIMIELPNLIHKIIHLSMFPLPVNQEITELTVKDIKKITNAECENALSYLEKLNIT